MHYFNARISSFRRASLPGMWPPSGTLAVPASSILRGVTRAANSEQSASSDEGLQYSRPGTAGSSWRPRSSLPRPAAGAGTSYSRSLRVSPCTATQRPVSSLQSSRLAHSRAAGKHTPADVQAVRDRQMSRGFGLSGLSNSTKVSRTPNHKLLGNIQSLPIQKIRFRSVKLFQQTPSFRQL